MRRAPAVAGWFALAAAFASVCVDAGAGPAAGATAVATAAPHEYVGRYAPVHLSAEGSLAIVLRRGQPHVALLFGGAAGTMVATGRDSFQVGGQAEKSIVFHRDGRGRIDAVTVRGLGFDEPLARERAGAWSPAERAARGEATPAVRALLAAGADFEILCEFMDRMAKVPVLVPRAEAFATALVAARPRSACAWNRLGATRELLGRRRGAIAAYRRALALDPDDDEGSGAALTRLGAAPAGHP